MHFISSQLEISPHHSGACSTVCVKNALVPNALVLPPPPHSRYRASPSRHVAPPKAPATYFVTVAISLFVIFGACAGSATQRVEGAASPRVESVPRVATTPVVGNVGSAGEAPVARAHAAAPSASVTPAEVEAS